MNTLKKCPICYSKDNSVIFTVKKAPYFTAPVKKEDKARILKKYSDRQLEGKLEPLICHDCSHIYLHRRAPEMAISDLYKKYYSYPSALEASFIPERDNLFLKIFNNTIRKKLTNNQKDVLEIGCYDGYILHHLNKLGFDVTGCDPSKGVCIGRRFGVNIKKRFFNVADFLKEGLSYDIIIFRHFLEHLANPASFLKKLLRILKPNGLIIFEVPNINFYLRNCVMSIFNFQHLQYFSKKSICRLLKKLDLRLVKLVDTKENLIVVCSSGESTKYHSNQAVEALCRSLKINFEKKRVRLKNILRNYSSKGIILWGAGSACTNLLDMHEIKISDIRLIVDSDSKKWGMEFLKYRIPIVSPKVLKKYNHGCLIICSMYAKEIISQLKTLHYDKPIINLYPRLELEGERNG